MVDVGEPPPPLTFRRKPRPVGPRFQYISLLEEKQVERSSAGPRRTYLNVWIRQCHLSVLLPAGQALFFIHLFIFFFFQASGGKHEASAGHEPVGVIRACLRSPEKRKKIKTNNACSAGSLFSEQSKSQPRSQGLSSERDWA